MHEADGPWFMVHNPWSIVQELQTGRHSTRRRSSSPRSSRGCGTHICEKSLLETRTQPNPSQPNPLAEASFSSLLSVCLAVSVCWIFIRLLSS